MSLPTQNNIDDPYEKADRHTGGTSHTPSSSFSAKPKSDWMSSAPRPRFFKVGGVIAFLVLLFYFFAPDGKSVTNIVKGG